MSQSDSNNLSSTTIRYVVHGTDEETGEDTTRVFLASSATDAEYFAHQEGIKPTRVEYMNPGCASGGGSRNLALNGSREAHGACSEFYQDAKAVGYAVGRELGLGISKVCTILLWAIVLFFIVALSYDWMT